MEYKVEYDNNSGVCVVQVSGIHKRPQDLQELLRIAGTCAAEHGYSRFFLICEKQPLWAARWMLTQLSLIMRNMASANSFG